MAATAAEAESVVIAFVRAMNEWEQAAWTARRSARGTATPDSYYPGVAASLEQLFAELCTPRERPYGRLSSFQHPPEYDPSQSAWWARESMAEGLLWILTERLLWAVEGFDTPSTVAAIGGSSTTSSDSSAIHGRERRCEHSAVEQGIRPDGRAHGRPSTPAPPGPSWR
jgi:hypothetical protein